MNQLGRTRKDLEAILGEGNPEILTKKRTLCLEMIRRLYRTRTSHGKVSSAQLGEASSGCKAQEMSGPSLRLLVM
jgi:hypothetical protein